MFFTLQRTVVDWAYYTEPSESYGKTYSKGMLWPRGKLLGGSGAINAMLYVRGNPGDYDQWEELGNPGWGWKDVLKYFKKSENNRDPDIADAQNGKYHGKGGYLNVEHFPTQTPTIESLIAAGKELGYRELIDINGGEHIGFGRVQGTIVNGTRCSPAKAFLNPIKGRSNLQIIQNARVINVQQDKTCAFRKVNFYLQGDNMRAVKAKKEIIISAGAIGTPQILMLSGIGPKTLLDSVGLRVLADLPVGKNLQDHVVASLFYKLNKSTAKTITLLDVVGSYEHYLLHKTGPFAAHDVTTLLGFINTVNRSYKYPDVQLHFFMFNKGANTTVMLSNLIGLDELVSQSLYEASVESDVLGIFLTLLNPKSKGTIRIKSLDINPYQPPVIVPNYFDDEDDVKTMIRAIRIVQQLASTNALKRNEIEFLQLNIPACGEIPLDSDLYWECYIRYMTMTMYHPVGTAKMGSDQDPSAVVDPRLRVRKTTGLRVADTSVMPRVVSGNTNAPAMMIGEKVSDMIKEDWAEKKKIKNVNAEL